MTKTRRYKTNYLFPKPSLIDGIGSIINISGNYFQFKYLETEEEADSKAIENDWGVVGDDFREVFEKTNKESTQFLNYGGQNISKFE